jgi:C-methyltransferase
MSANAKVPPAQVARVVERVRHHLYRLHQRLVPAPAALSELVVGAWVAQSGSRCCGTWGRRRPGRRPIVHR